MLRVTVLTCAIIAMSPLCQSVRADDIAPPPPGGAPELVWTGRFTFLPQPAFASAIGRPDDRSPLNDDIDIVGSIPSQAGPPQDARPVLAPAGAVCPLPASATDPKGQDLACRGTGTTRWSRKIERFNYDLSDARIDVLTGLDIFPRPSNQLAEGLIQRRK